MLKKVDCKRKGLPCSENGMGFDNGGYNGVTALDKR